jgi:hypothetical protein
MRKIKFKNIHRALAISLATILAACTPGRIDYRQVESAYDGTQDHWAPYNRSLTADVSGNPFAIPQDDFNQIVNAAIQPAGYPPSPNSPYRLRMIFNGPASNSNYICQDKGDHGAKPGQSLGTHITLSAAYCRGNDGMTFVQASVDDISGPNDPRLREFLRMIATQLFPLPESDPNSLCMLANC